MFFDEARIFVKAGDGGNGAVAFRREKFVPFGGPAGGHGGHGGNIVLRVDPQLNTLIHFKNRSHFKAERGGHGGGKKMHGANGEDMIVPVPPGTIIRADETSDLVADLTAAEHETIIAQGGRGGRGNTAFRSATNQAPKMAERGLPGEERWIRLELKLIADVGLLGMPNAGKSTLLSVVSAARPKIAAYPFTTLQPNLGVVVQKHRDLVIADIPGLIEGAHTGAGLGHQFLRHVERSRFLLHLLAGDSVDPLQDFITLNNELAMYSAHLAEKPQIMVLNKTDLPSAEEHWAKLKAYADETGIAAYQISAVTQSGLQMLISHLFEHLDSLPETPPTPEELPTYTMDQDDEVFEIVETEEGWQVSGPKIERLALQTMWDVDQAVTRAHIILREMGVYAELEKCGVQPGDTVLIHDVPLEWVY